MTRVLFLSHTARSSSFRVGSHHLSRELARQGHDVAHIATPFSLVHRYAKRDQVARRAEASLGAHSVDGVTDLIPAPLLPADWWWSPRQMRTALKSVALDHPDVVFIDQPLFRPDHFPDSIVVFRPTDLFAPGKPTQRALDVARHSDAVFATSPGVLAAYGAPCRGPRTVFENGVEYARFHAAATQQKQYDFVYLGSLDQRFSFEQLRNAAVALPQASFAIFGPRVGTEPSLPPNVELMGAIEYDDAPAALARGRWGIMPFSDSPLNAARSPMKLYEYVAAGLPVIAPSATVERAPGLRSAVGFDATDPHGLASRLALSYQSTSPSVTDADLEYASSRDWGALARQLLERALDLDSVGSARSSR